MSTFNIAITTRRGRLLFSCIRHPLLSSRRTLSQIIKANLSLSSAQTTIEIQRTPFLLKKRTFLGFLRLWSFRAPEDFFVTYGLKKSLQLYPWPACLVSQEGVLLFANPCLAQALGYSSEALEGLEFIDLFEDPPHEDFLNTLYHLKSAQGHHVAMTISHMIPEGPNIAVFLFPAGFQTSLRVLGDPFILSQIPLPAALLDEHGGLHHTNALFKEKLPSVHALPLTQWIAEKDRHGFSKQLKKLRKDPQLQGHYSLMMRKGEARRFLAFLKYLPSHDKKAPGQFLAIFTMEDHLLPVHNKEASPQKLQMLGQLASGIVHDFNNLLTGILGFCDLLLQRHSPQEASFKDIDQIKQSAMRAARLIQQLLAFSKSSPPSQAPISLKKCIQDLFPLMRRMIGPKIFLTLEEKTSHDPTVYGDSSQLEQLLLNLAINARDAMVEGGSLTFFLKLVSLKHAHKVIKGTLSPKRYVVIDIKDTGTGIDPHHIDRIFDPFFSTKDQGQGTGLGLSNVLQTMEQFQGGITVETQLGHGSTFSLYFPEHRGAPVDKNQPVEAEPSEAAPVTGIRVLLVEDEDPVRLFAARALREKGHEVIEARDGGQALRLLKSHNDIHIVVTDVMMPGIDGPTLAASTQSIDPSIKILFVSGYPEEEVRSHLPSSMKEVYFLPKPFALADLVNKIQGFFVPPSS